MQENNLPLAALETLRSSRRQFLSGSVAAACAAATARIVAQPKPARKARIAITLDLEMSAQYPKRGMTEWNYQKGNLDEATKKYAVEAARIAKERGGLIHFFCVGQVLEQPNVDWLKELAANGHPIGNHTYDHVNVKATKTEDIQFRFQRAPWLLRGQTPQQVIVENIRITTVAMKERAGIMANGFRTPGGFANGLADRPDIQKMLLELGFSWVSSKYPAHQTGKRKEEPTKEVFDSIIKAQEQAQPFRYPSGLIEVPMSPISDVTAFRSNYWKLEWFLSAIRQSVQWAIETGGAFDFLAHPSCLEVEDPTFESIKLICDLVKGSNDKAAVVSLAEIANSAGGEAKK
jgi:peptidoglycan/xylan/chitin deacetylase (PgdA/CDA1 family)